MWLLRGGRTVHGHKCISGQPCVVVKGEEEGRHTGLPLPKTIPLPARRQSVPETPETSERRR